MDNCFTGRRDRSCQTSEKDVLYILLAGWVTVVKNELINGRVSIILIGNMAPTAMPQYTYDNPTILIRFTNKRSYTK